MPQTVKCPLDGFEQVEITFPEQAELTMAHYSRFGQGMADAPPDSSFGVRLIFGSIALCDKIEGLEIDPAKLLELPLYYSQVLQWIVQVVYHDTYSPAVDVPKN